MTDTKIEITISDFFGFRYRGTDKVEAFYSFSDSVDELDENQLAIIIDTLETIHRSITNKRYAEEQKQYHKCNCKIE